MNGNIVQNMAIVSPKNESGEVAVEAVCGTEHVVCAA